MTNEEIEQTLKTRISKLKEEPAVKEYCKYLELLNYFNGDIPQKTKSNNQILVYMGTYSDFTLNTPKILYYDLWTAEHCSIPESKKLEFEQNEIVIHFKNEKKFNNFTAYDEAFKKLRNRFFEKLLTKSLEDVEEQILNYSSKRKVKVK